MTIQAQTYRDEDGVWVAEVPSLPGCISDGATEEEALRNVAEAAAACIDVRRQLGLPIGVQIHNLEVAA